jgi:uncharacterized protein YprB with RNaseH-like and TPR domain
MMLDRLRRLYSLRPQHARADQDALNDDSQLDPESIDDLSSPAERHLEHLVVGESIENDAGTCFVSTRRYPLEMTHGPRPLADLLQHAPCRLAKHLPHFNLDTIADFTGAAFLDTETTGLGAGAYCFMVGVGIVEVRQETQEFVVRQFFMRHPGEEAALLTALAELLAERTLMVTFNGRSFDAPLLRARYALNRRVLPAKIAPALIVHEQAPHLDLLQPARRLWKRRLQSCRLINLEEQILSLQRSEDDVPGALIPQLYLDFLRSGDARQMRRVFYHNCEDIVSMAAIAEHVCGLLDDLRKSGVPEHLHGLDWLSLGQSYERAEQSQLAENAYRRAIESLTEPTQLADAFRLLGQLQKRQQRWQEAAATWELWLTSVPSADASPYIELAKYCEWQSNDLGQAEMWTAWAKHMLSALPAWQRLPGQLADLEHRLARLKRKQEMGTRKSEVGER